MAVHAPTSVAPKVVVVTEFYPRRDDPVLGVWAHRQALAAQAAGVELRVLVLHRLVPARAALSGGLRYALSALTALLRQPLHETRDGVQVTYVRYVSPPRPRSYARWGAWAAPALALALRRLRREGFAFELIHAHNAVPAGDAAFKARPGVPLVVSVHGGDVLFTASRVRGGREAVSRTLAKARLVLANSRGIEVLARGLGATQSRVVRLGAQSPTHPLPHTPGGPPGLEPLTRAPALVTVGHLVARKRHADVMRALAVLTDRHPTLRYVIVGAGPERPALESLAARLGVSERVELCGQLEPAAALARMRSCTLFAMPSTEEAFGVAYIEAMAAGLPAIGCRGEPGPEEIAKAGDGFVLVPPGDIERLSQRIDELLSDPDRLREAGRRARATVAANFTWELCGAQTRAAYEDALRP
ncbi:MAG TPA: glycosyltransferase [Solirubrobacteraceae bacterium]|jgi:glycosyltransferase involved in cell wall biosynthesis|nr:glycosyltransferase [Solirubrobacteraceae bacterium]